MVNRENLTNPQFVRFHCGFVCGVGVITSALNDLNAGDRGSESSPTKQVSSFHITNHYSAVILCENMADSLSAKIPFCLFRVTLNV